MILRQRMQIEGIVQGVGFRPFVHQAATRLGLSGWVRNDGQGVTLEVEGSAAALAEFRCLLREEHPPLAAVGTITLNDLSPQGEAEFRIFASDGSERKTAQVSPDAFVCEDCLRELFSPGDRRYRYPFINCTNCGPRYTIVTGIPYDRPNTTMASFAMCEACREEYQSPASRRFHAQPIACPDCGPTLALLRADGETVDDPDPLEAAIVRLREGRILAVKGLGGYHLTVDAGNEAAVRELRRRKERDEKPFAIMAFDLERVGRFARLEATEARLLSGTERPIVLLRQKAGHPLAAAVAPGNRYFGVMLPYTPLHYILLEDPAVGALVMTSGNRSDEPIVFDDANALRQLRGIADYFLVHNRPIHIRTDDSIARVMAGQPLLLRRSRGFVPRALPLPRIQPAVLAVGAELKNTFCLTRDDRAYLSQHIGDLKNAEVLASLETGVAHLQDLLELQPQIVAHDLHPDYLSTHFADRWPPAQRVAVQHHHAHLASCLAEHGRSGPAIGVIFDGSGYGEDGTIWGGEFLVGDFTRFERAGHLRPIPMPGGDAAVREPWRMGLSLLWQSFGRELPALPLVNRLSAAEKQLLLQMLEKRVNTPMTSSCGRLFDAVAALAGLRDRVSFEGQAALELEMSADESEMGAYPFQISENSGCLEIDSRPLTRSLVADLEQGVAVGLISARYHNFLAAAVTEAVGRLGRSHGLQVVALSGGVFQNCLLTERIAERLRGAGFEVLLHSLVPPNDGGLALGQAVIAGARMT